MKNIKDVAAGNALAAGVTQASVSSAIARSGYPLQGLVAAKLVSAGFHVREEWSYLDSDTDSVRNVDLVAEQMLFDYTSLSPQVRPLLNLIVECKKSDLPIVFFSTHQSAWLADFPMVAGLRPKSIELSTDDSGSTWDFPILMALGLAEHAFLTEVTLCSTLSKCVRRSGGELELSGDETYNGIVLPLLKAAAHFEAVEAPAPTHLYFDGHLAIPLAVVDAPMILAKTDGATIETELKPWIRVVRHEHRQDEGGKQSHRLCALDVVHVSFLDEYLQEHVAPFSSEFSRCVLRHENEVATGKGFASGLEADSHSDIESRMQAGRPRARGKRSSKSITSV